MKWGGHVGAEYQSILAITSMQLLTKSLSLNDILVLKT